MSDPKHFNHFLTIVELCYQRLAMICVNRQVQWTAMLFLLFTDMVLWRSTKSLHVSLISYGSPTYSDRKMRTSVAANLSQMDSSPTSTKSTCQKNSHLRVSTRLKVDFGLDIWIRVVTHAFVFVYVWELRNIVLMEVNFHCFGTKNAHDLGTQNGEIFLELLNKIRKWLMAWISHLAEGFYSFVQRLKCSVFPLLAQTEDTLSHSSTNMFQWRQFI